MKNIIRKLYEKYCRTSVGIFMPEEKEITEDRKLQIYIESKQMIDLGVLKQIMEIYFAESEAKQLYESKNFPIQTTEAELERQKRVGIEDLWRKIEEYANKVPGKEEEFNKHEII